MGTYNQARPEEIPADRGLCHCGCGESTPVARYTNRRVGIYRGAPLRFISGHQARTHGRSQTPEYQRERALMDHYGMSLSQYEAMREEQGGRCYICRQERSLLQVDHDHATGAIRKLLCNGCNSRLSMVEDPVLLNRALAYLEEHRSEVFA